jgi:hypothetical protein
LTSVQEKHAPEIPRTKEKHMEPQNRVDPEREAGIVAARLVFRENTGSFFFERLLV